MAVLAGLSVGTSPPAYCCGHELSSVRTCGQCGQCGQCDTGSVVMGGGGIPQKLGSCLFYCFMATISLWLQQAAAAAPCTARTHDN